MMENIFTFNYICAYMYFFIILLIHPLYITLCFHHLLIFTVFISAKFFRLEVVLLLFYSSNISSFQHGKQVDYQF